MIEPYKQIEVVDFSNPERKAVFTLESREDLLVRVEVKGGQVVRMEAGTLRLVSEVMMDLEEQRQAKNQ